MKIQKNSGFTTIHFPCPQPIWKRCFYELCSQYIFVWSQGKNAKFKKYVGHSAHVTNVRWSHDDKRLISVGGADTSVMIWSHEKGDVSSTCGESDDSDTDSEEEGNIRQQYYTLQKK